ncbi:MAG: GntR family transcriptional regulator [bacterium]|jgi:GntR family transcriptional regulator
MNITVDLNNSKPTYLQIVECIRRAIAAGALQPGDQLPTIREAAVQARVNRNTVSRAYLELEHLGLVVNRQGSGTYVSNNGPTLERKERRKIIQQMVEDLTLEAYHYQIPIEEVIHMIRESARKWGKETANE